VAQEYVINENGQRFVLTKEEFDLYNAATVEVGIPTVVGSSEIIKKPDGTTIDNITGTPAGLFQGSARRKFTGQLEQTGITESGATINPNNVGKEEQDPTKTAREAVLGEVVARAPFEGPYDNILENFSTYNALWTLACLEPNQFNNPSTYRDNPAALTSVVFSSAGRFEAGRVSTVNGTPEYFVDNVEISALMTPVNNGNTNAIGFTFDIYEPYSMGLFLQSLQAAAINAGYPNYLGRVPYLFKLDFIGNTDDGDLKNTITAFTKYFTMQITGVTQAVDASGSRYTVTAVPFHHMGFNYSANNVKTALKLTGGSISEVLATGENSLVSYLNKIEDELVKGGKQDYPDINEIVFPAAILQPPFYNYTADEAVNYGGIGAVIGHEISHAFDDSGARFDGDGNVNNWWTPEDLTEFEKRGKALADQYSALKVLDSVYVNGLFTLGENIGDLGGVLGAYDGLQLYFEENGRPEDIDGFTAEQRFFMSWATVWRTLTREDALRTQIKTDPHSPGNIRATQPLKNIDAFYQAFNITEGDAMYLPSEQRVRIW
jgi:hypothetical protein